MIFGLIITIWLTMVFTAPINRSLAHPVLSNDLVRSLIQSEGRVMKPEQFFALALDPKYDHPPENSAGQVSSGNIPSTSSQPAQPRSQVDSASPSTLHYHQGASSSTSSSLNPNGQSNTPRCRSRPSRFIPLPNAAGSFGPGVSVSKQKGNFLGQLNTQFVPLIINKYV